MEQPQEQKKSFFRRIYEDKYKTLLIIPILLFILAVGQIGYQIATTGDFVNKGVSLKGGITLTIHSDKISASELQNLLETDFPKADFSVRELRIADEIIAEASEIEPEELVESLGNYGIERGSYTIELTGSSLGKGFFRVALAAVAIAFLLMAVVVFMFFRSIVPSAVAVVCVFCDIVVTLAIFNLTGIKLATAGIAGFLMLIGYSIDTDMLLSTRVLKIKEGTLMKRIYGAMKTGLTMTVTTVAAVIVALLLIKADSVRQIMLIIVIGLLVDVIYTWIQNVALLRMYVEKKGRKHGITA